MSVTRPSELSWQQDHRGVTLRGPNWTLRYDLLLGLFDLSSPAYPAFQVRWARARALYKRKGRPASSGTDDGRVQQWEVTPLIDPHGPGLRLVVRSGGTRQPALEFSMTIYQDSPFLILELTVHNTLDQAIAVDSLQPLEIDPEWGGSLTLGSPVTGLYSAGWQSWSPAGWKPAESRDLRTLYAPLIGPILDAPAVPPLRRGRFAADTVGALTCAGPGPVLLCGLLTTADQLGTLQGQLAQERPAVVFDCETDGLLLAPNERLSSERIALLLSTPQEHPLETYGEALGREMGGRVGRVAPSGWCSWTAFYLQLGEEEVLRQMQWLAQQRDILPVEVIQIDDGWEQAVGHWEPNERFPHGMAWLAQEIRRAGFTPGLWLAPLIAHPRSPLVTLHPEWLLQDERGRPVNAGLGWGALCRGLDVTHPEVQAWLQELISTVTHSWGYAYLKLDFLYAAAVPARRHRADLTRAQALRLGLELIRQAAGPETFLLGCGCPLGPAIGLVDGMRISADIAPHWLPRRGVLTPFVRGEPSLPAMANAIRNDLAQAWAHRRLWLNDPDALILREAGSDLTTEETRSLATLIALSGGVWMLGDDLPGLEPARVSWAAAGLPLHREQPYVPDLLERETPRQIWLEQRAPWGQGWLVALFNWDGQPADLTFDLASLGLAPDASCHLHEYWSGAYQQVRGTVRFPDVAPHGCRTFLVQPVKETCQWVGSTLQIVQGQEVRRWEETADGLDLVLDAGRRLEGTLLLWLPRRSPDLDALQIEGGQAHMEAGAAGRWQVHLQTDSSAPCRLSIRLRGESD